MNLEKYFSEKKGLGVLATSDARNVVNAALISRPHVQGKDSVAFIMRNRLTRKNLRENRHAHFLFMEERGGYIGVRLFLSKISETKDHILISSMTRRSRSRQEDDAFGDKFLVNFKVDKILSLTGGVEIAID